ncbi:hypothetical protein VN1229_03240 [Helicobacter pylori]|nr:hypothetical protein VN1229_03240 [Helicobacter pylori]
MVFTNTQAEAGDTFVKEAQKIINEELGFGGFVRAYVRVNSVKYSFRGMEVPVEGLKELVDETKKCLSDAMRNHFLRVQKIKIQERKQAMIDESKSIIHFTSGAAGVSPIPLSDMPLITTAQMAMIYKMNRAFKVKMEESIVASLITGLLGFTAIGQTAKTIVANLIKCIPGVGSVVGARPLRLSQKALGLLI